MSDMGFCANHRKQKEVARFALLGGVFSGGGQFLLGRTVAQDLPPDENAINCFLSWTTHGGASTPQKM